MLALVSLRGSSSSCAGWFEPVVTEPDVVSGVPTFAVQAGLVVTSWLGPARTSSDAQLPGCRSKAPICCGDRSSTTLRPGLSRRGGMLQLPAFAATSRRGALVGEVIRLSGGTVTLQDAVDAFLEHQDLARSTRRVYRASLASLVAELGRATAVGELSGPRVAGWFRDRHATAAPATWNRELATLRARGRLVAPPRLARRRPDRWPGASPRAGRPHPGSHPRSAGAAVCPPRSSAARANLVAAVV
jgi:hypothetical protein